jgi:hypothetical protein
VTGILSHLCAWSGISGLRSHRSREMRRLAKLATKCMNECSGGLLTLEALSISYYRREIGITGCLGMYFIRESLQCIAKEIVAYYFRFSESYAKRHYESDFELWPNCFTIPISDVFCNAMQQNNMRSFCMFMQRDCKTERNCIP